MFTSHISVVRVRSVPRHKRVRDELQIVIEQATMLHGMEVDVARRKGTRSHSIQHRKQKHQQRLMRRKRKQPRRSRALFGRRAPLSTIAIQIYQFLMILTLLLPDPREQPQRLHLKGYPRRQSNGVVQVAVPVILRTSRTRVSLVETKKVLLKLHL